MSIDEGSILIVSTQDPKYIVEYRTVERKRNFQAKNSESQVNCQTASKGKERKTPTTETGGYPSVISSVSPWSGQP